MPQIKLHWQILIAIGLAIVLGVLLDESSQILGITLISAFDFFGTLFLNALKMLIVPLIFSSIVCGICSIQTQNHTGGKRSIKRMAGKTLGFYMLSSLLAILVGLAWVNILTPGQINGKPAGELLNFTQDAAVSEKLEKIEGRDGSDIVDVFLRMVPTNIIHAAANGEMLGLITFALLFGFFITQLKNEDQRNTLQNTFQGVFNIMMNMTLLIMKFSPIGVLGLVSVTIMKTGFDAFLPLVTFFFAVVIALACHAFITMPLLLKTLVGADPILHLKAMFPAMLTAFSTASSAGTLPVTLDCVENKARVSNQTSSFVLPLGATVNMDGTALYECVAAMFIAQAYGLDLTLGTQFTIVVVALLTSIGVAGIPAASLVAISVILTTIGLPLEAIGLLLVTDRVLDMLRTAVNVFSDSCCAVVVAKSEGETQVLT